MRLAGPRVRQKGYKGGKACSGVRVNPIHPPLHFHRSSLTDPICYGHNISGGVLEPDRSASMDGSIDGGGRGAARVGEVG
jgi:hypothetical protein